MAVGLWSADGLTVRSTPLLASAGEAHCEPYTSSLLGQPISTLTSLAFVVAGIAIATGDRGERRVRRLFGALVVAVGIGSVIQHGPNPALWADLAHDLPLVALIAYLGVDAASDLAGRRPSSTWWTGPTVGLVPLIVAAPRVGDAAQALLAVVVAVLWIQRARVRPVQRTVILTSLALLGVGGLVGSLSRAGGPLCDPGRLLQGHALWHVLAAAALWWLAPAVGARVTETRGIREARDHAGTRGDGGGSRSDVHP